MVDWKPTATLDMLRRRAALNQAIRSYFQSTGALEVETPQWSRFASPELHIDHVRAQLGPDLDGFLQTSPEWYMKRLLAVGSGDLFQLSRVFRYAETGKRHQPEFTLLEWYRDGLDLFQIMDDTQSLLAGLLPDTPCRRQSFGALFQQYFQLDPFTASLDALREAALKSGFHGALHMDRATLLDFFLDRMVADSGDEVLLVYGFPLEQASYAAVETGPPAVALRFEVFWRGLELANGYQELTQGDTVAARADAANRTRQNAGKKAEPLDPLALQAVSALPRCSGVALGVERLLMAKYSIPSIEQVMSFPAAVC